LFDAVEIDESDGKARFTPSSCESARLGLVGRATVEVLLLVLLLVLFLAFDFAEATISAIRS
jgi:hypothetical protein